MEYENDGQLVHGMAAGRKATEGKVFNMDSCGREICLVDVCRPVFTVASVRGLPHARACQLSIRMQ